MVIDHVIVSSLIRVQMLNPVRDQYQFVKKGMSGKTLKFTTHMTIS